MLKLILILSDLNLLLIRIHRYVFVTYLEKKLLHILFKILINLVHLSLTSISIFSLHILTKYFCILYSKMLKLILINLIFIYHIHIYALFITYLLVTERYINSHNWTTFENRAHSPC